MLLLTQNSISTNIGAPLTQGQGKIKWKKLRPPLKILYLFPDYPK